MSVQHIVSALFICYILLFFFFIRPSNKWHYLTIHEIEIKHYVIILLTLVTVVLLSVWPMSLSPYWNGTMEYRSDKQQYDRMGDALLQGHLYIDNNDIDPALKTMENPYDYKERERLGIKHHWDEAYYNHHYYMYFGVVPTIILFIPFKLLTGHALLSYQATQIFASLTIIGIFYLFYVLCRNCFPRFPYSLYLILSSVFSVLSIGYSIAAPALYCTAIVSAVCLMVWSIICFLKGVWFVKQNKINTVYLVLGAFLGALSFGCRPPVALANIIIVAVAYQILKSYHYPETDKIKNIAYLLFPYLVIGILVMLYNYARFDNPFEFGQSYQLTLADQHEYGSFWERFSLKIVLIASFLNFYAKSEFTDIFPFIWFNGVFINFPILLLSARILAKDIRPVLKERKIYFLGWLMFFAPIVITLFDVCWTPFLLERYHLDLYYLLCIVTFFAIAAWLEVISDKWRKMLFTCIIVLAFVVLAVEFLLFCIPYDGSYTFWYPEVLTEIYRGLRFGL